MREDELTASASDDGGMTDADHAFWYLRERLDGDDADVRALHAIRDEFYAMRRHLKNKNN